MAPERFANPGITQALEEIEDTLRAERRALEPLVGENAALREKLLAVLFVILKDQTHLAQRAFVFFVGVFVVLRFFSLWLRGSWWDFSEAGIRGGGKEAGEGWVPYSKITGVGEALAAARGVRVERAAWIWNSRGRRRSSRAAAVALAEPSPRRWHARAYGCV